MGKRYSQGNQQTNYCLKFWFFFEKIRSHDTHLMALVQVTFDHKEEEKIKRFGIKRTKRFPFFSNFEFLKSRDTCTFVLAQVNYIFIIIFVLCYPFIYLFFFFF